MNSIDLANIYVEKYLYKNEGCDDMYEEIIKPFSEEKFDRTSFLSYTSGRIQKHIEFLNEHIIELKKEIRDLRREKDDE